MRGLDRARGGAVPGLASRQPGLARAGAHDAALDLVEAAVSRLAAARHLPWWAQACICRVRVRGRAGLQVQGFVLGLSESERAAFHLMPWVVARRAQS